MSESKRGAERRRHQRVEFKDRAAFLALWPGGLKSEIYDMSYKGAALERPAGLELNKGQRIPLKLSLGERELTVTAEVMWLNEELVGVQFPRVEAEERLALNGFLEPKLLGASLIAVERRYFGPDLDCDHWYHGRGGLDVFVWMTSNGERRWVSRALVEFPEVRIEYNKGTWRRERWPGPDSSAARQTVSLRTRLEDILARLADLNPDVSELVEKLKGLKTDEF